MRIIMGGIIFLSDGLYLETIPILSYIFMCIYRSSLFIFVI
jgi:hypothetical protein